jgi:hypothetical protein
MTGLALCSSGIFVCQAAASSFLGRAAGRAKSSAAGLYSTFYYGGGTAGAALPAFAWRFGGWPACVAIIITALACVIWLALNFWGDADDQISSSPRPLDDEPSDLLPADLPAAA